MVMVHNDDTHGYAFQVEIVPSTGLHDAAQDGNLCSKMDSVATHAGGRMKPPNAIEYVQHHRNHCEVRYKGVNQHLMAYLKQRNDIQFHGEYGNRAGP